MPLWSEKVFEIISILLNLLRLALCPSMWSILENVPCALEKNVYSDFCTLGFFFLLFLVSLGRVLSIFVYLFNEPTLGLVDFVYCFLNLYFIDFLLDLHDVLLSADFRFFLFFFF